MGGNYGKSVYNQLTDVMARLDVMETEHKNVWELLQLKVSENQRTFVASNETSIIEVYTAIYNLWRLMIDEVYQGKGYGKEACRFALEFIRSLPCRLMTEISLC